MMKLAIAALLLGSFLPGASLAAVPILPFDEVEAGMTGTGRTVFAGTRVETFDVEVLGKLPNIGPDQDLILARLSGGPLAETRVLAGMSGSPVTVDGKLIGAVAYSWGFTTDAIAGITPIEQMLAVAELDGGPPKARTGSLGIGATRLARLTSPDRLPEMLAEIARPLAAPTAAGPTPTIPLSTAGFDSAGLARILPDLARAGFLPTQAGGSRGRESPAPPLEPGSAVGLKLVRGDLEMTATGTATWIDGDRVLAFGHPLFGLGAVDLPLTGAEVQLLLPSLQQSSRIATPLAEIGALRQDRASAVFGRLGASPRMIPVRLQLKGSAGGERTYSFDLADDPLLSPLLLYVTLNGILASRERGVGNATVRLEEGSGIKMVDGEDVALDNVFAGPAAFDYGTGLAAYILYLLMNNAWTPPQIAGVNLILDYDETPRTGRIRRAALDRYRVRPGETIEATVVLDPFRGPARVFRSEIEIPAETPPGTLTLHVGSALAVNRTEEYGEPVVPGDLVQLIRLINQLRRNDRIYVIATREDSGLLLGGARLPNLPPSVSDVLSRPKSRGNVTSMPHRRVLEEVIPTDYAVEGSARIQLEVEAR